MRIEAHDSFGKPIRQEVTRIVVYDDFDNPLVIAIKYGHQLCYAGTVDCPQFNDILKMLGINKTVITSKLNVDTLNENPAKTIIF